MSKYSSITRDSIRRIRAGALPPDAWKAAAAEAFPPGTTGADKGCPKSAFLGLIDLGLVRGISPGGFTRSVDNKEYARLAVEVLRGGWDPSNPLMDLWREIQNGSGKSPNYQMDVVVQLWNSGEIVAQK